MAIVKMKLVNFINLSVEKNDIDGFAYKYLIDSDELQPEYAMKILDNVNGLETYSAENPCVDLKRRCNTLLQAFGIKDYIYEDCSEDDKFDSIEIAQKLSIIEKQCSDIKSDEEQLESKIDQYKQIIKQLQPLTNLDVKLDQLFKMTYFKIRFGCIPKRNYSRLMMFIHELEALVFPVSSVGEYEWLLYILPTSYEAKVDAFFNSLHFERSKIYGEMEGTPSEVISKLTVLVQNTQTELFEKINIKNGFISDNTKELLRITSIIVKRSKIYLLRKYATHTKNSFHIIGWMPEEKLKKVSALIEDDPCVGLMVLDNDQSSKVKTPTLLKNNWLIKPFEFLVKMYGLPAYNEIDPTGFVALVYLVLFGMMFGDVGQGIIIALAGILLACKKIALGGVMVGAGLSSIVFGFLYGSIFGMEDVLVPIMMNPMDDINTMLIIGISLGAFLIMSAMVLNIINSIKKKEVGQLLFDRNGLAGLLFYGLIIYSAAGYVFKFNFTIPLSITIGILILLLILIFLKHPLENIIRRRKEILPEDKAGFFIEAFFELIDMLLSFLSNTVSFVRVSAFAINHVGLSMAVMIMSEMFTGTGSIIVIVIGNIIVIGLEGLIVGIQGMRLTYYELFSRFFSGEGKPFTPLGYNIDQE